MFTPKIKDLSEADISNRHRRSSHTERFKGDHHSRKEHDDNFIEIEAKQLLDYLSRQAEESFPFPNSLPAEIYSFFINICNRFGVQDIFH